MYKFNPFTGKFDNVNHVAKLVEVEDSAARLALTSAQVNVGDIVREVGVPAVLGTVIVTGAGTTAANATYTESGTDNGKPVYTAPNGYYFSFVSGYWELFDDANMSLYYDSNYEDPGSPADVGAWAEITGTAPLPTVTQGVTPVPAVPAGETYVAVDTAELDNAAGWQSFSGLPPFQITNSANTSLGSGSWVLIPFGDQVLGEAGEFVDNGWKPSVAGSYLVVLNAGLQAPKNGSRIIVSIKGTDSGDYIEIETQIPGADVAYGSIQGVLQVHVTQEQIDADVVWQGFAYSSITGTSVRGFPSLTFMQVKQLL